jgi:anionic cell wall polymer biosynthesis LytR-Cps2A-Psr (LCP) family protein
VKAILEQIDHAFNQIGFLKVSCQTIESEKSHSIKQCSEINDLYTILEQERMSVYTNITSSEELLEEYNRSIRDINNELTMCMLNIYGYSHHLIHS